MLERALGVSNDNNELYNRGYDTNDQMNRPPQMQMQMQPNISQAHYNTFNRFIS